MNRLSSTDFAVGAANILKIRCGYREKFVAEARRLRKAEKILLKALLEIEEWSQDNVEPDWSLREIHKLALDAIVAVTPTPVEE